MGLAGSQAAIVTPSASMAAREHGQMPIHALVEISQAMASTLELNAVLDTILGLTLQEMQAQEGSILLFDEHQDRLVMLASAGLPQEIADKGYIPRKGSIAEYVIENDRPLIINDSAPTGNYTAMDGRRRILSAMCVPLRVHGKVLGTINLNRTDMRLKPFIDDDLEMMTILGGQAAIFIENSRLHQSNMQAERLAAIGQTVAGISHCIKNVLTGVRGGMSLIDMASDAADWKAINQGRDILRRNLERLSSIVLDMLDFSKERVPLTSPVSVRMLVEEILNTLGGEARTRRIDLTTQLDERATYVEADAQQVYRCLLNLAHNALDATPEGGCVTISSEWSDQAAALRQISKTAQHGVAVLRVTDTGCGIPEEKRQVIFEPFFSTKGSKGTGLGLAVTRKIIDEHGGKLRLETVAPQPASFAIYLPATEAKALRL